MVETIVGQMPPSAFTPCGQPKIKSSEMCGKTVDDHVGDNGDQYQRGDIGRGAKHAEHNLVGQILVDAALLTMGKGTLDALAR